MRDSVLIVGGGRMGCGIAAIAAAAGNRVIVVETSPAGRQAGPKTGERAVKGTVRKSAHYFRAKGQGLRRCKLCGGNFSSM